LMGYYTEISILTKQNKDSIYLWLWWDIALRYPFSQNKTRIVYIYQIAVSNYVYI
jgi:hypothetical protein